MRCLGTMEEKNEDSSAFPEATYDWEEKIALKERKVESSEFEIRMRKFIVELLEPTIHRVSRHDDDIDTIHQLLNKYSESLNDVKIEHVKEQQTITEIEQYHKETIREERLRRIQEARMVKDISLLRQELQSFRYNLERKEGTLESMHRSIDRAVSEINRVMDLQDQNMKHTDGRLDSLTKQFQEFRKEFEVQLVRLETKNNSLADELWGEEAGLAKVTGELNRTNVIVSTLNEEFKKLQNSKAPTEMLDKLQEELNKSLSLALTELADIRDSSKHVVKEVKEHFKTASNTIATHNAATISEFRQGYTEELQHLAKVRSEVVSFMEEANRNFDNFQKTSASTKQETEAMVKEVRLDIEDLHKKRKRDKSDQDIEIRQFKKRLGGVFDNSDLVLNGLEHLTGVLSFLLESNKIAASLEQQDNVDRQQVALFGYKEVPGTPSSSGKTCSTPSHLRNRMPSRQNTFRDLPPVISIDNKCLSCSGQACTILAGFKMACLQYQPGIVMYNNKNFERGELFSIRCQLLEKASESLQFGPDSRFIGDSTSPKAHFDNDSSIVALGESSFKTLSHVMSGMPAKLATNAADTRPSSNRIQMKPLNWASRPNDQTDSLQNLEK